MSFTDKVTSFVAERITEKVLDRGVTIHIKADAESKSDFQQAAENLVQINRMQPARDLLSEIQAHNNQPGENPYYGEEDTSEGEIGQKDAPTDYRGSMLLVSGILIGIAIGHFSTRSLIR